MSLTADTFVDLQSVTKRFGDNSRPPVLSGITTQIARGEFISLIGPSGCGKSTLLRLIAGLTTPTAGRVLIENQPAATSGTERAFIFQDATLLPWLTVQHNAELLLKIRGVPADRRRELATQLLSLARIGHLADRYPRQLSGGEKMRVSLARALTLEPSLLLLDEPFGALDELTREHLNEELLSLHERQRWTALFVTHSVTEAVFLSTRILVLSTGRIAHDLPVDLPFPRNAATREHPAFHQRVADVSRLLRQVSA
ncbi:ABC transporter ATP-binding protein [Rariglobus hedericola]|uniref:ABC transporter ATP-binding protein n=1 Tax=Rariglobus hedericola TaxID=2597822 RepID=A0A556QMK9_9BACT|nr:ABC transporter ATP-binding protein [Rariglobus hedericola]TSJ77874.1 ABC transporter ATP-binding protein [Rariglobus hedericola]